MKKIILLLTILLVLVFPVQAAESKKEIRVDVKFDYTVGKIGIISNAVVDRDCILVPISIIDQLNQEAGSINILYAAHYFEDSVTLLTGKNKPKLMMFINKTDAIYVDSNRKGYLAEVNIAPQMIDQTLYIPLDAFKLIDIKMDYTLGDNLTKPVSRVFKVKSMDLKTWIMIVENSGRTYEIDFSNRALGVYSDFDQITLKYAKEIEGQTFVTDGVPDFTSKESLEIFILDGLKQKITHK